MEYVSRTADDVDDTASFLCIDNGAVRLYWKSPGFFISHCNTRLFYILIGPYRMALIVPACQPGWEEMESLRGNWRKFEDI